jgi:hypothetical protein
LIGELLEHRTKRMNASDVLGILGITCAISLAVLLFFGVMLVVVGTPIEA